MPKGATYLRAPESVEESLNVIYYYYHSGKMKQKVYTCVVYIYIHKHVNKNVIFLFGLYEYKVDGVLSDWVTFMC